MESAPKPSLKRKALIALSSSLVALTIKSCAKKEDSPASNPAPETRAHLFSQIGPTGGIISAIKFHPSRSGEVWACADDGGGVYKSTDSGATWAMVNVGSLNHACYAIEFDPTDANRMYIPSHFGRGLLKSTDGGATWSLSQAGLPIHGDGRQRVYDIAVDPITPANVYAATGAGLYRSTDYGANFTLQTLTGLTTPTCGGSEPDCRAVYTVAIINDGGTAEIYIGEKDGELGIKFGSNNWVSALGVTGTPIWDIQATTINLYVAFKQATLFRFELAAGAAFGATPQINDPSTGIYTSNKTYLAVKSGGSATTDTVFVGTFGISTVSASRWGLFRSTNSGSSWSKISNTTNYVFSLTYDPGNVSTVLTGSGNAYGIHRTTDGGSNWSTTNTNVYGTGSLGGFQSLADSNHLLASYTAGGGFGGSWESTNGGASWARIADPAVDDGVMSFWIDPRSSQKLVAGMYTKGIWRIDRSATSSWTQVNTTTDRIDRIIPAEPGSSTTKIYAIAANDSAGTATLYYSADPFADASGGLTARSGVSIFNIQPHPSTPGEAIIAGGTDVFATNNYGATRNSLGLSGSAGTQSGFCAVAYHPTTPSYALAAGCNGGIFRTTNYTVSGSGTTWAAITSPITAAGPRDLLIAVRHGRPVYYVVAAKVDHFFTSSSTVGIFRSLDEGQTWSRITTGNTLSELAWKIFPDRSSPTTQFLFPMWGGGMLKLTDTE